MGWGGRGQPGIYHAARVAGDTKSAGPAAVSTGRGGPRPRGRRGEGWRGAARARPAAPSPKNAAEAPSGPPPGKGRAGFSKPGAAAAVLTPLPTEGVPARIAGSKGDAASTDFSPSFFKSTPFQRKTP